MQQHLLIALLLFFSTLLQAQETRFQSGTERNQLIELYTSEGCSSCPPAERYLNGLTDNPKLWNDYIPVAFHVDYWNRLGWKDRFSSAKYSARQRAYARHWRARTVYTPAFFINGREWRRWSGRGLPGKKKEKIGNLAVQVQDGKLSASFQPQIQLPEQLVLHVARLGMERTTRIRAGERAGEQVTHQFVVLGHETVTGEQGNWQTTLPHSNPKQPGKEALAVWVTRKDNPLPIQAVGGYLPTTAP
ncbi:MAG: DUF1223 domain-containing protein [Pseudomonadota bacterium]|nr:DUF1223 domain-containing protein [Pseudomonadota bacterium]